MSKKELEKILKDPTKGKTVKLALDEFREEELAEVFLKLSEVPILRKVTLEGELLEITEHLGALQQIKVLHIRILEGGSDLIPKSLASMESLEELIVERNFMRSLPAQITELSGLKKLVVRQTEIQELPANLSNLSQLKELCLTETWKFRVIPEDLGELRELRKLCLDGCYTAIPESLSSLYEITELELYGKFTYVPLFLADLPKLKKIFLRGRFCKVNIGFYDSKEKVVGAKLKECLRDFNRKSSEKMDKHRQSVPWLVIENPVELNQRPLLNVPVFSSFKTACLPKEEVLLIPGTESNRNACRALADGAPMILVSEVEDSSLPSIEGYCKFAVLVELLEYDDFSSGEQLRVHAVERVLLKKLQRSPEIALAEIHSVDIDLELHRDIVNELTESVYLSQQKYLKSIGTTKRKVDSAVKALTSRLPYAIKRGEASFLIAPAIGLAYSERQALLVTNSEKERLKIIARNLGYD